MKRIISGHKKMPQRFSRHRKREVSKKLHFSQKFNILALGLIVILGLAYLVQMNGLATRGYKIKDLEKSVAQLRQSKSDLELEALALQSVGNIKGKLEGLGMVSLKQEEFLNAKPVALNR